MAVNKISTDFPLLQWRKESKSFAIESSTLHANGFEPLRVKKYEYGKFYWVYEFIIENPKSGNHMKFTMNPTVINDVENLYTEDTSSQGSYYDLEGELMFDVFVGENGISLVIFNDQFIDHDKNRRNSNSSNSY